MPSERWMLGRPARFGVALALAAAAAWLPRGSVAAKDVTDRDVEAAFIYHFTHLVEWPASARTSEGVIVGVVGNDPLANALETTIFAATSRPRPIRIVRAQTYAAFDTPPHVLFVGARTAAAAAPLLRRLRGEPVLTVGDAAGFAEAGGMIGFRVTEDGRVAFDINLESARGAGLKISSQVLKLARIVTTTPTRP